MATVAAKRPKKHKTKPALLRKESRFDRFRICDFCPFCGEASCRTRPQPAAGYHTFQSDGGGEATLAFIEGDKTFHAQFERASDVPHIERTSAEFRGMRGKIGSAFEDGAPEQIGVNVTALMEIVVERSWTNRLFTPQRARTLAFPRAACGSEDNG